MSARARMSYYLTDAAEAIRQSPGAHALATGTLVAVLGLAALVLLGLANVSRQADRWADDLRVAVYLRDDATVEQVERVRQVLLAGGGVRQVVFVGKDEALRRFRESFSELADASAGLETNPLPASLEAVLDKGPGPTERAATLVRSVSGLPGIEEARYDRAWLDRLDALLGVVRAGGTVVGILVLASVAFVMAGVLRLVVRERQDEIDIMLLVGASPRFVRGPYLVGGMAQGLVASGIALLSVEALRRAVLGTASPGARAVLEVVAGNPLPAEQWGILVLIGLGVGLLSSFLSVRDRVRDRV